MTFGCPPKLGWDPGAGGGGGGITEVTSVDGSVTVTNPTGPVVDLSAAVPSSLPAYFGGNANNVSVGTALSMTDGVACSLSPVRGVPVVQPGTLDVLAWGRDDTDDSAFEVQVFRGGASVYTETVPVGTATSGSVAIGPFALAAGDQIYCAVAGANGQQRPRVGIGWTP